jgi:phosphoadenosine phosphosulfate reductase
VTLNPAQQQKIDQVLFVIEEAFDTYPTESMVIAWSGGKDSTLLLKLILDVCRARGLTAPKVLDIDQGDAFDEIIAFRIKLVTEWELDLVVVRNSDVLDKVSRIGDRVDIAHLDPLNQQAIQEIGGEEDILTWTPSSPVCNYLMKAVPVREWQRRNHIQVMFTGIRWDEHSARQSETYFSARTNPSHTRIHPLLHLSERDIWDATFALDVPYNALYAQGYRSIDTRSGTHKVSDVPAWQQDLDNTRERGGRSEEKEKMMEQLRALGYM